MTGIDVFRPISGMPIMDATLFDGYKAAGQIPKWVRSPGVFPIGLESFVTVMPMGFKPVAVTTQPNSLQLKPGGTAKLKVAAKGSGPLTYQWYFNGHPIAQATKSSYAIPNAQAEDEGWYYVVAKNGLSSAASVSSLLLLAPDTAGIQFSDDFNDNSINSSKWTASGNTVAESDQIMQVLTTVTDAGGDLVSKPFAIARTGLVTITRRVFLHHDDTHSYYGQNHFFVGSLAVNVGTLPSFSVQYASMDYADGSTYMARHGFFLSRNGANPVFIQDQADVSDAINPVWDTWFNERITYDPASGVMEYFINDVSQMTFNVGVLPQGASPTMTLGFNAWGWYTGHEQLFDALQVRQFGH
jgi:hypothetical protein